MERATLLIRLLIVMLAISLASLSSCTSYEEYAQQEAAEREQLERDFFMQNQPLLRSIFERYGPLREIWTSYDGPSTGTEYAHIFIRSLSGAITDRRLAFFELSIEVEILERRPTGWCRALIVSKFIDRFSRTGESEVLARGEYFALTACDPPFDEDVLESLRAVR